MAHDENALGAPTEGLGQTVTFALKGVQGGPQIDALGAPHIQQAVQGGQGGALELTGLVQQPKDNTMALLLKVAGEAMMPMIEKQRKEAYLTGMQKARSGQALLDIAAEQPWYSRIFGESDVVSGARAFTQQDKAQRAVLALQEQMPELRKRGMDEARAVMSDMVDKSMTGDAETDVYLMNAFSRTLPSLMSTHAREHYKWTQEQAVETHGKMLASGAQVLQEQATEHFANNTDSAEYDTLKAQYLGLVAQPAGMDDEAYHKALSQHIAAAAEAGQFHAIKVLRDAGAINLLPEKERAATLRVIDVNERQLPAGPQGDEFADRLFSLRSMAHQIKVNEGPDPEVLRRQYEKLNADWMAQTGSTRPMVDKKAVTSEAVQMYDEIQQALDRDHRERLAAAKEAAKEAKLNHLLALQEAAAKGRAQAGDTAWRMANPSSLLYGSDPFKPQEMNAIVATQMKGLITYPGELDADGKRQYKNLAAFLSAGAGDNMLHDIMSPWYQSAKAAGTPATPQFAAVYDNYLRIKEADPTVLGKVFDSDTLHDLNKFNALHPLPLTRDGNGHPQIGLDAAAAFAAAINPETKLPKQVLNKEEMTGLVKQIIKDKSFYKPEVWGGEADISTVQANNVALRMNAQVESLLPTVGGDMEQASKQAWATYEKAGGRVIGGFALQDRSLKGMSLNDVFTQGNKTIAFPNEPAKIGRGFKAYIKSRVATVGGQNFEDAQIMPTGDGSSFTILTTDRNGQSVAIPGSYAEVGKLLDQYRKDKLPGFPDGLPISEMSQKLIEQRNKR